MHRIQAEKKKDTGAYILHQSDRLVNECYPYSYTGPTCGNPVQLSPSQPSESLERTLIVTAAIVVVVVLILLVVLVIVPIAVVVAAITVIVASVVTASSAVVIRVVPPAPVAFLTVVAILAAVAAVTIAAAITVAAIVTAAIAGSGPGARSRALPAGTAFVLVVGLDAGRRIIMASTTTRSNPAPIKFADGIVRIAGGVKLKNAFSIADICVAWRRAAVFTGEILQILPRSLIWESVNKNFVSTTSRHRVGCPLLEEIKLRSAMRRAGGKKRLPRT
mmetsp:Transcript_8445/g.16590  ORF Transcript_8445/g.16590 Transcript_8445/m.16590 type:complete len:276 (+) Transcript_8445:325-1152(+)